MSANMGRIREFLNRNIVYVVGIPSICFIQYAWFKLQDNETFVRKDERREFPAITIYKHMKATLGLGERPEKK